MKQRNKLNICVYCGSSDGKNPKHLQAATALGEAMAAADVGLVYGGANVGLMGATARAVLDNGGYVVGVRPPDLPINEIPLETMQEYIQVDSLHERKMIMFQRADAFVALPGGVGTLEELVEQITWVQLALHHKPVIIANIDNYWAPLLQLLEHMKVMGFIAPNLQLKYHVVTDVLDIIPLVKRIHLEEKDILTGIL
jgi:uncharacterized protein (TIGR00730 family)